MPTTNFIKKLTAGNNIVPLVMISLVVYFYLLLVIAFDYVKFLDEMESVIVQGNLDSHKMRLNSEMMEIARTRTQITNQIIDIDDPFDQDKAFLELENLAGRFAALREEMLGLELDAFERHMLLEEHPKIVSKILPGQRKAVNLAMSDKAEDIASARKILYETVFPKQRRLIETFGQMIAQEQRRIEELAITTLAAASEKKKQSYILISLVVSIILVMSVLLVLLIRKIQHQQLVSRQSLERTVLERTQDLQDARDALQRYVDMVDKYVITSHTDKRGIITYTSAAFCQISQYSEAELIGSPHRIVRHPDMPKTLYEDLWRTIKQGKSWRGEIKNRAKDGSSYWVDVNIEPQFDSEGQISGYVAVRQDITDKKRIEEISITDTLTRLYNRLKLDTTLSTEVERANRYGHQLSLILFDVDNFKQVNDTYGHQTGDAVLIAMAEIVRTVVRTIDIAGRWGGEEFLIICPDTDLQGAAELAERLRHAIAQHDFGIVGHKTSSFGVSLHQRNASLDELLAQADRALYRAKESGRNCVVLAGEETPV